MTKTYLLNFIKDYNVYRIINADPKEKPLVHQTNSLESLVKFIESRVKDEFVVNGTIDEKTFEILKLYGKVNRA